MTQDLIEAYWHEFLSTLPQDSQMHSKTYYQGGYGDTPAMAKEVGNLILIGKKTASCSSLWEHEAKGFRIPEVGDIWIGLDWWGDPICITETIEVAFRKYHEVDADFAREEGEGDQSLNYWREAHKNYFSRVLSKIGKEFSEDIPLVCERFRVIYK